MTSEIISAYSDAGIIGGEMPGLTWAFCHVGANDNLIQIETGIMLCASLGVPKMNSALAETYAAMRALWPLPDGWEGTFYCDNETAIGRIFWQWACDGVPPWLAESARAQGARLRIRQPILLGGHPIAKTNDLENGFRARDGKPVSKWNVLCDKHCERLRIEFERYRIGEWPNERKRVSKNP